MVRQPKCYQTSENEWVCTLCRKSGNSLGVTIPKGVVMAQCLRPGIVVKLTVSRMPQRPAGEPVEDARDPSEVPSLTEGEA